MYISEKFCFHHLFFENHDKKYKKIRVIGLLVGLLSATQTPMHLGLARSVLCHKHELLQHQGLVVFRGLGLGACRAACPRPPSPAATVAS
jgi:hypothetical protein